MSIRALLLALGWGGVLALGACSSPTQSVAFSPPVGWAATPSIFGIQAWHTADGKQVLMLLRLPVAMNPSQAMQQSSFTSFNVETRKKIVICGRQPAVLVTGTGTNSSHAQNVEMVLTSHAGASYMAMYARDSGVARNAQAERAIYSLCPRS